MVNGFTNGASTFPMILPPGSNALELTFEVGEYFYPNIMFTPAFFGGEYRRLQNPTKYGVNNVHKEKST